ncbi:MAG: N-acetylmuramoyl-L-alanine amidase [Candidatus Binatia bacterium]
MMGLSSPRLGRNLQSAAGAAVLMLLIFPIAVRGQSGNSAAKSGGPEPSLKSKRAVLTQVRHISSDTHTRVIIELSSSVTHETHVLEGDGSKGLPPRIYVNLIGARLAPGTKEPRIVEDRLIRQIRVGQFDAETVRVVLDMKSLAGHNAFMMPDPYRLVIDIDGGKGEDAPPAATSARVAPRPEPEKKISVPGIKKIVLDPGHGGKDTGAIGAGGLMEKDVVLIVAKKLAKKLAKEMGVEVVLTRDKDVFIPLEDRTGIANAENADLFISLHVNASPSPQAKGIETYYLDNTDDEAAIRLAARENGTSRRNISDIQFILSDLIQNSKLEDSIALAHHLQSSLVSHLGQTAGAVKDLGVKKAPFYVLVQAKMPSVLAEIFFITNKKEGQLLSQDSYQNAIVEALYKGIKKYRESPTLAKSL